MNPIMTFVLALVRHGLTLLGGVVTANGHADSATWETIAGGVLAAIGVVWSLLDKKKLLGR